MNDIDRQAGSARGPTDQLSEDMLARLVIGVLESMRVPNGYKDRLDFQGDVLSGAFLRVKEKLGDYDPGRAPLEHFIYGVVSRFAREAGSRKVRDQLGACSLPMDVLAEDLRRKTEIETPKLDRSARDLEWIYEVLDLIASERQRRISEMRRDGHSFEEIAERLDVSEEVAWQDMTRLRKKVVEWFADELRASRESVKSWIDRLCRSLDYDPLEKQERSSP